jgi:molybdopterin-guanine dinucleotide biosynthesis protein A
VPAVTPTAAPPAPIVGAILAGGRGRRLGGVDKGLVEVAGRPLVEWVIAALAPQVDTLLISANRHLDCYSRYGYPVLPDSLTEFQGPLAGLVTALDKAAPAGAILAVPCDNPVPPPDLASRLLGALLRERAELAVAHDGERLQPLYALIPFALRSSLASYLASGERKVDRWYARHRLAIADFSDRAEAFANLNRPQDLERIERLLAGIGQR